MPTEVPVGKFTVLSGTEIFITLSTVSNVVIMAGPMREDIIDVDRSTDTTVPPIPSFFSSVPAPAPVTGEVTVLSVETPPTLAEGEPVGLTTP